MIYILCVGGFIGYALMVAWLVNKLFEWIDKRNTKARYRRTYRP